MRVVMIVTGFPSPADPVNGVFNLRAAKALSLYVDVTVIHLRAWKPGRSGIETAKVEGMSVIRVTVPQTSNWSRFNLALYLVLGWSRVRSLLDENDLIHSVDLEFSGILGSTWGRWARVPHVTQLITDIPPNLLGVYPSPIMDWRRHVQGVACNSRFLAQRLLEVFPETPNVRTVYRGVDLQRYEPDGAAEGPLKDQPPVRFLYLGGFPTYPGLLHNSNTKGGDTLLEAWQAAEDDLIPAGASLCVAGPDSDSCKIFRWRTGLKMPQRVHLTGLIHPEAVPGYIRSSDAVLIPSLQEGLPNVAMEASACARAVFGSDIGGIPEVITTGQTGLILSAGNVTAWKDALREFATKLSDLRIMGRCGRQRMLELFDSKEYAPKMLDLYTVALREPLKANQL